MLYFFNDKYFTFDIRKIPVNGVLGLSIVPPEPTSTPGKYYIDCKTGADSNSGATHSTAWKSLYKVNTSTLEPGFSIYLKRGCVWNENLIIYASGSKTKNGLIDAYGDGQKPVIKNKTAVNAVTIKGSAITIQNINVTVVPSAYEAGCENNPVGEKSGISFETGSAYNILQNSIISGAYAGVYIRGDSHHNTIKNNEFINNNMMYPLDHNTDTDAGAFSVLIWGDDNEISYNKMQGSDACSYDYKRDGSAVEIFGGKRNIIKYNKAYNNDAFTELGNPRTSDNTFAYNLFVSASPNSYFLVTRGHTTWGPIYRTTAVNNTAYLTGSNSNGFACLSCNASILTMKNNIIWAKGGIGVVQGSFNDENNIFWGSRINFRHSKSSKIEDPKFVNPGSNFQLSSSSSAIGAGTATNYRTDINNRIVVKDKVDIGAFQN